jgi:hypothetical protein
LWVMRAPILLLVVSGGKKRSSRPCALRHGISARDEYANR